ncbi:MAG: acetyl-CoA decarbonylase/synthase complex subunit gamma, partial [Phycisphaeraceae bacterium]|nr:acetyl-CoA decarbonylase/synthase complex subunit gamma [Phycisphaeraceae bacterium]
DIAMPLTGIQIYKLLPKTNCKDCGLPTCLAFSMKLAAQQIELSACPHVSAESKTLLADASEPPIRLVALKANGREVKSGNETVLFRHEKTFFNKAGLFVRVRDDTAPADIKAKVAAADAYNVRYVGMDLSLDGFAVQACDGGSPAQFAAAVTTARSASPRPLILIACDPAIMAAGLQALNGESPLIYCADINNWEAMADLAKQHKAPLAVRADTLDALADLTAKIKAKGVNDLVLDPACQHLGDSLVKHTLTRRLALKKNFRPLGYPTIAFPGDAGDPSREAVAAAQAITKYAGFVVLERFAPEMVYPLLVLRENIYTDPQKPIQVQPGLYEINNPKTDDPVLVTTNFSITYFSVANEVESSGMPAWLLIVDAEGMSVLTAWAAGKFDADRIAKAVKETGVANKISNKRIVLPGHVAVLSGEIEEALPGWEIRVGPREAVDLPAFMKQAL